MITVILAAALIGLASYNVGKFAFKRDDQRERFAEHLLDLGAALQAYGLKDIPKGMQLVAIKDYSGAIELVKFYVQLIKRDPSAVIAEFDKVFERVLEAKKKTPEGLAFLKSQVADPAPKIVTPNA